MSPLLKRMLRMRIIRHGIVGACATTLQEVILLGLVEHTGVNATLANAYGFTAGAQLSFVLSNRFTWNDRKAYAPMLRVLLSWLSFNATAAIALGVSTAVFSLVHFQWSISPIPASLCGVVFGFAVTLIVNDRITFRSSKRHKEASCLYPESSDHASASSSPHSTKSLGSVTR